MYWMDIRQRQTGVQVEPEAHRHPLATKTEKTSPQVRSFFIRWMHYLLEKKMFFYVLKIKRAVS